MVVASRLNSLFLNRNAGSLTSRALNPRKPPAKQTAPYCRTKFTGSRPSGTRCQLAGSSASKRADAAGLGFQYQSAALHIPGCRAEGGHERLAAGIHAQCEGIAPGGFVGEREGAHRLAGAAHHAPQSPAIWSSVTPVEAAAAAASFCRKNTPSPGRCASNIPPSTSENSRMILPLRSIRRTRSSPPIDQPAEILQFGQLRRAALVGFEPKQRPARLRPERQNAGTIVLGIGHLPLADHGFEGFAGAGWTAGRGRRGGLLLGRSRGRGFLLGGSGRCHAGEDEQSTEHARIKRIGKSPCGSRRHALRTGT